MVKKWSNFDTSDARQSAVDVLLLFFRQYENPKIETS